jgi:hypothetical protein
LLRTEYSLPPQEIKTRALHEGSCAVELKQTTRERYRIVVQSVWAVRRSETGEPLSFLQLNRAAAFVNAIE